MGLFSHSGTTPYELTPEPRHSEKAFILLDKVALFFRFRKVWSHDDSRWVRFCTFRYAKSDALQNSRGADLRRRNFSVA